MMSENLEIKLCPACGSTNYIENYPTPGTSICEKCGQLIANVKLVVIQEETDYDELTCPFCSHSDENQKLLLDKEYGLSGYMIVLQCNSCGKPYGFRVLLSTGIGHDDVDDRSFSGEAIVAAKTEGKFIYSASAAEKIAKALKQKERDPLKLCRKRFYNLAEEKTPKILEMGVIPSTIDIAKMSVYGYLLRHGPLTDKQFEHLFSAAIALTQDRLANKGLLKGKRLTERQIAQIFEADRNTTRKWKNILDNEKESNS